MTQLRPTHAHLLQVVLEVLTDVQTLSGEQPCPLSLDSVPLETLPNFDSVRGVEASFMLSAALEYEVDPKIFVLSGGRQPSVRDVVDRLHMEMNRPAGKGGRHGRF